MKSDRGKGNWWVGQAKHIIKWNCLNYKFGREI